MVPASSLFTSPVEAAPTRAFALRTRPTRRRVRPLRVAIHLVVLALVAAGAAALPYLRLNEQLDRTAGLERRLSEATAELEGTQAAIATGEATIAAREGAIAVLRGDLAKMRERLAAAREAKVRTVVEERIVTEKVIRWIPNGEGISVEVTGFQGMIGIRDVQLAHSYGFSDLVGIAVNKSGSTISYAQLGCTFLDAEGRVLANAIANKQGWAPGQTWGFTCSAQVDATGGILRVDEMS